MWELAGQLAPEMVGLAITPAAVVACLLLLGSSRPFRNVVVLGGAFLGAYAAIAVALLAAGRAVDTSTADPSTPIGWIGVVVGALFLIGGTWSWVRPPRAGAGTEPAWVGRLRDPSWRLVLGAGLALAVVNPNVAILASGVGVIVTADASAGEQTGGLVLLLAASMLDFVAPTLVFALAGPRGRSWLRDATRWLLAHNRVIGIVVLVGFGLLFIGRGLAQLAD